MYIGNSEINAAAKTAKGKFITINGEKFYEIENYDAMQPFFISLASDTNLWMYISSTGGLTCGRISPDQSLFPYYTDDKVTDSYELTGPKTIMRVTRDNKVSLWEPFSDRNAGVYRITRNIAKSVVGNQLLFTEINHDLGLAFSYRWCSADKYGWIRKARLENLTNDAIQVEMLDGLQNVLPAGIDRHTQNTFSTLVDGYKKTELVEGTSCVLFRMEAILVDRAEPSESLRCNVIYSLGLNGAEYLVSSRQLDAFRRGLPIVAEPESKGVRAATFAHTRLTLLAGADKTWYFVADTMKDAAEVRDLMAFSLQSDAVSLVEEAVTKSTATLREIVGQNDGIQQSADEAAMARHFANVLFNTMRGGFYCDNYQIGGPAFRKHVALFNKSLASKHEAFLAALPESLSYSELEAAVLAQNDAQLRRLFMEYLPLTFSRRHGDPSRPWNLFNIRVNDENGNRLISYQGNWRDIFQNWEALSLSYPGYINGIIAKFLNATTVDGYNPYKVTSEGIDWEVIVPEDPWSNIGYWGDHQIVYLLKLLELSYAHNPQALNALIQEKAFAFANVPYRLKTYSEIVADPKNSIRFDDPLHKHIFSLIPTYGQDARLVLDKEGNVRLTTFTEKLLITLLTKLSNLIPEAGIWMNTLRPEWNDANNALVGYGTSMVTLCYMRRFVTFLQTFYSAAGVEEITLSSEVFGFLCDLTKAFLLTEDALAAGFTDQQRRQFADAAGLAGEHYRTAVYAGFFGKEECLDKETLLAFLDMALRYIDQSIRVNLREDGLYNAYNTVSFSADAISIKQLYQMLEGQVAVLTSYALNPEEIVRLLQAMRKSDLYRADQNSYMLYPARRRPSFLEKNNIPADAAANPALQALVGTGIILKDRDGGLHFNGGFNNADFLARAIDTLPSDLRSSILNSQFSILDLYEQMFDHQSFTGRSGTFYKYEGLGCIYWHMVSKLLLAIGENIAKAVADNASAETVEALKSCYYDVQEGIGAHKQPDAYGSFPFDPYSHTPSMAGVQQPGMTGQVKEDIINRFFELGLSVFDGQITIKDTMLNPAEFLDGMLRFTYCSTPFVYRMGQDEKGIRLTWADGREESLAQMTIPASVCSHIFARDGQLAEIQINF